jgi:RNA polymerase sigma factor (sigma-70 family)
MTKHLGLEESFAIGEMDTFYQRLTEKVSRKLQGQKFAGMEHDDVIQESLIKVFKYIDKYDSSKSKLNTFLEVLTDSVFKDCFKKASSGANMNLVYAVALDATSMPDIGAVDSVEEYEFQIGKTDTGYEMFEVVTDLMKHLGLTDREKEVFKLRANGYGNHEIADQLGISRARITQIWTKITDKANADA